MYPNNQHYFYGWNIVAVAFLANFMSVGTGFYAFNAFMEPLCDLRNWTRTDINMALVFATLIGFMGQFIYGTLVIRTGARMLMITGPFIGGLAFFFLMRADQLWQFYVFYILLYMGNGAYGGIVASTAVNNWFQKKRGKALGIATSGISFSGAILPLFALFLILRYGIEHASTGIAIMIITVAPISWLIIRDWPEHYGMLPDGAKPGRDTEGLKASRLSSISPLLGGAGNHLFWSLPRLLKTNAFWKLGFAYALIMMGTVGVMSQLKPRFSDIGFGDTTAMLMMAATAFMGTLGKYVWGMLCDRFEPRKIVTFLSLANGAGLSLMLFKDSMPALYVFIIVFGFTMGGIMSTYPIIVADLFGRTSFAVVLRFVSMFLVLQLAGYIIAGQSFDRLGSYDPAYMFFIALDVIAAGLLFSVKRPAGLSKR